MIARWVAAGMHLCETARHPSTAWAKTVGGILMVSGFKDFLGNYSMRRTLDDPVRQALGILAWPDRTNGCVPGLGRASSREGVSNDLIPSNQRESDRSRERAMGKVVVPIGTSISSASLMRSVSSCICKRDDHVTTG